MEKGTYLGPRIKRLRKEFGLTQSQMATDLDLSPSYIALIERNHRPVTAEVLLRLARAYKIDMSDFAQDTAGDNAARLQSVLQDPIFADIDLSSMEIKDSAHGYPGIAEAMLRLYTAYREEQLALADRRASRDGVQGGETVADPVAEVRHFLAARRNCFPPLDAMAERLAASVTETGGLVAYLRERHGLRVRRMGADVMLGSLRRYDRHRREILLDEALDAGSQAFQLAQQVVYIELTGEIEAAVEGQVSTESAKRLAHRALAAYGAGAILMPYTAFAKAAEARRYDVEALARLFGTSFEQTAHRLTTLQRPGQERVPFFFIRVDAAGNVTKRLDGANFPFARHGGGCPLWTVHQVFSRPGQIVTQWLELPEGQRFFSIARTVRSGGGAYHMPVVERAVALVCEARHAGELVYAASEPAPPAATPIGIACRLCHRASCTARSEPPIGRQILWDVYHRPNAPFGLSDA